MAEYISDEEVYLTQNVLLDEESAQSCNFVDIFTEVRQATAKADEEESSNTANRVLEDLTRGPELRSFTIISDEKLSKLNKKRIPESTKGNPSWYERGWQEWAQEKIAEVRCQRVIYISLLKLNILKLNDDDLNCWLSKFVVEIRKKKPRGEV